MRLEDFHEKKKILELNVDFEEVKNALVEYLKEVNTDIMSKVKANGTWDNILGYCVSKIGDKDFNLFFNNISFDPTNQELNHTYFLNFNYTSYLDICVAENDWGNRSVIPIHGRIEDVEGVIFGYGDDTHEKYHKLEQDGNDELLLNIKSFYYADHQRYLDIINNLDEREYEVVVIGHSLGLSDRVLLKTIFEHKNCAAIRLYHRGGEKGRRNHFKKRIALSRHFEDKLAMRGKIIPYNDRDVFN